MWEEANFVRYVLDPPGFLQKATGLDWPSAKQAWIHDREEALDVWASLSSFSPAEG